MPISCTESSLDSNSYFVWLRLPGSETNSWNIRSSIQSKDRSGGFEYTSTITWNHIYINEDISFSIFGLANAR